MAPLPQLTPGTVFARDFRVLRHLSAGGMGAVYVVEQMSTQRQRALKIMLPDLVREPKARERFMKAHGRVFFILGLLQRFWYSCDKRREQFVKICRDPDVQQLTWQSYMHKELVRRRPMAHVRIFFKDLAHLMGMART